MERVSLGDVSSAVTRLESVRNQFLNDPRIGPDVKAGLDRQSIFYAAFLSDAEKGHIQLDESAASAFQDVIAFCSLIESELSSQ